MMSVIRLAFYARVSSQKQASEKTIQSQCDMIRKRIKADGGAVLQQFEFLDDGYSGTELLRPALEKLRDAVSAGVVNRLYVYSVDRLARKMSHQLLLLDELKKHGCEVIFMDQPERDESPESTLFTNMQGVFAEYEREKILERTRRGRKYSASKGNVSVFSGAPYGYRYITKAEGGGKASWVVDTTKSEHVKLVFDLVGNRGFSLSQVSRELAKQSIPSEKGNATWRVSTIRAILINPAYYGMARFGKTRLVNRIPGRRARRGAPAIPRCAKVKKDTDLSEQIEISVPAIIEKDLFERVNHTMDENKKRKREHQVGTKYLLSGKIICGSCGAAYCASRSKNDRHYYRCRRNRIQHIEGFVVCQSKGVIGIKLEAVVWAELCRLLKDPKRIQEEYRRRESDPKYEERKEKLTEEIATTQSRLDRLIDVYEEGALERGDFITRTSRIRSRKDQLTSELIQLQQSQHADQDYEAAGVTLASLSEHVQAGLETADWDLKRTLIKLLIKQIEVHAEEIRIVLKVPSNPFELPPDKRGVLSNRTSRLDRVEAYLATRHFVDTFTAQVPKLATIVASPNGVELRG